MKNGLISIGEAADYLNVSTRTLRYYEEIGLIKPKEGKGKRFYSKDNIKKLMYINELKDKGCSLKEIEGLFGGECCNKKFSIMAKIKEENEKKIEELKAQNKRIEEELEIIEKLGDLNFEFEIKECKSKSYKKIEEEVAVDLDKEIEAVWDYTKNSGGYSYDIVKDLVFVMNQEEFFNQNWDKFNYIYSKTGKKDIRVTKGKYLVMYARNSIRERNTTLEKITAYIRENLLEVEGPLYMYPKSNILCKAKQEFLMISEFRIKLKDGE